MRKTLFIFTMFLGLTPCWSSEQGVGDFKKIVIAAKRGDAIAQCQLGWIYDQDYTPRIMREPTPVPVNNAEALKWWRKSAAQDYKEAMPQG